MKTYLEKLYSQKKEKKFISALKQVFPNAAICLNFDNPFYDELILRKDSRNDAVYRIYHITDYDCKATNDFVNVDYRSAIEFSDAKVKEIYVSFMKANYKDYENDYLQQSENQTKEELCIL